ncbi:MAG: chemotaxis protein CheB [Chlorobiaceae bacterium]
MKKAQPSSRKKKDSGGISERDSGHPPFPVVGIGSSAGGLEALEIFLTHVPTPCGIAFVIIQHLDPTHKGIMVELLQRITPMPVVQVTDRLQIEPDHVYLIPPNQDMTMLHGTLHLLEMVKPRGLRLPIDFFFRSMADDLQQHSIGVILSGMGSDGTLGLRAIKEKGGSVFVQDPSTAKFDGMPRSAIDEGLADVIAPVTELPSRIFAYLKHPPVITSSIASLEERALSSFEKIVILLRSRTGHDFSFYKKSTIYRRIERRMAIHQVEKITDYVRFLQGNPNEIDLLFKELLIGVTSFFRDPAAWKVLKEVAIPSILALHPSGACLRAWVAGCSTGEEAYSLAIAFREVIEKINPSANFKLQIFATDLDKDAIDKARTGTYSSNIAADLSAGQLDCFFEKDNRNYRILRDIRETIVFAPQNVIMDPPFTKLDILICRNLLIYMEPALQKKLLPLFHYSLNPGGILFLGSAETVGSNTALFEPVDSKMRLFRHHHQAFKTEQFDFPSSFAHTVASIPEITENQPPLKPVEFHLQSITEQFILQNYAPAAVLTNDKGDIIYISGRTGKYLEPAAGKANWNLFAMAREGIRYELNLLFSSVLRQKGSATRKGLLVESGNGGPHSLDLTVSRLEKPEDLRGLVLTVFTDAKPAPPAPLSGAADLADSKSRELLTTLEDELKQTKDEILTIREEMQTSQEELKSTNEEMQSANEEMQSTNEELTTSKEEMQSLNEELQTVNQELQSKVNELSQANNDMKNLLNSTDIATLFLDDSLNIRRYTNRTVSIIKLIASDIGRPITDIVTDLEYPALAEDSREVLRTLVFTEKQVSARDGRWFTVKIMPYRTQENRIDGLVITFTDITSSKNIENTLQIIEESMRFMLEAVEGGALFLDAEGRILIANRDAERIFGYAPDELQGKSLGELRMKFFLEDGRELPSDEHPALAALRSGKPVTDLILGVAHDPDRTPQWISLSATPKFQTGKSTSSQLYMTVRELPHHRI